MATLESVPPKTKTVEVMPGDAYNAQLVGNVHPPDWVNPHPAPRYNLVVLGAGTAGLVTAAGAAGLGAKVALVERYLMGGDCLNVGCVPSKAIIRASRVPAEVRDAARFGTRVPEGVRTDFAAVMERVRVYGEGGMPQRNGRGLFAAALLERFPLLPVEEEGRLHDMPIRENFVVRVFAYYRWKEFLAGRPRPKDLVAYHTRQKLLLLAHDAPIYRRMGRLVAQSGSKSLTGLLNEYGELLMTALRTRATHRKQANVLQHLAGYLKRTLDRSDRAELANCIASYRSKRIPLVVPITLLLHHFRRHPVDWVMQQSYLNPYPAELMLRNHV
jgi:uncharacterized protein YbgA (DUF1722 family)